MKRVSLMLVALMALQFAFAQSEMYVKKMQQTLQLMDSAKTTPDMQEVAAQFERIGDVEKTQWLPFYYAAMTHINIGWRDRNADKDKIAATANALIAKAEAIEKNAELYVLEYMVALQQMTVDPQSRYMSAIQVMNTAMAMAKKADPNNPRIYYMEGNNVFNTPAAFGGGKDAAKPLLQKAVDLYKAEKPASPLHPKWGKKQAEDMLAKCSS